MSRTTVNKEQQPVTGPVMEKGSKTMVKLSFPPLSIFSIVMVTFRFAAALVKPSNSQAKLLDYEIGAIIHFNMETFVDTFKTGKTVKYFGLVLK